MVFFLFSNCPSGPTPFQFFGNCAPSSGFLFWRAALSICRLPPGIPDGVARPRASWLAFIETCSPRPPESPYVNDHFPAAEKLRSGRYHVLSSEKS